MNSENKLVIEQLNKFGRVPQTHELLQMIEQSQQENKKLNGSIQTYDILLKANVEENKRLKDNWNKLKECIKECLEAIDTIQKLTGNAIENYTPRILTYRQILDKMQEIEKGSDSNE